jgi:hypothetical protein
MSFKTFLLVTQGETFDAGALDTAIGLATSRDAHLEVLCLGIDRMQVGYYFDGASAALIEQGIARARAAAKATEAQIARRLESESLSWGSRSAVAQVGAIPDIVGHAARFSDMVVIGKPYGKGKDPEEGAILEAALFEGRVPVLIVPGATAPDFARRIVLGWNQTARRHRPRSIRAGKLGLWVAISAAMPRPRSRAPAPSARRRTPGPRSRGRGCRSARRPAAGRPLASARQIATRCCSPARQRGGTMRGPIRQPDRDPAIAAARAARRARHAIGQLRQNHVLGAENSGSRWWN